MSIELGKSCADGFHEFNPITEGSQTVGLICRHCGKSVRENMAHSGITVDEKNVNFPPTFFEEVKHQSTRDFKQVYHRKDPRF